jgi:hypothetical protein
MNKYEIRWYKTEGEMLDRLYADRQEEWQKLYDAYELKFDKKIRDLRAEDVVKVSRFYPIVRQVLGTIAHNYPVMAFNVEDEVNEGASTVLERAANGYMNITNLKSHIHQAIFDALFTGVGWIRLDYNPPGDDMIAPYTTNDDFAEDLVVPQRVAPGFVHVDPTGSPHRLGDKRYIREKFWTPIKYLQDDPRIQNKKKIKPTQMTREDSVGYGEVMGDRYDSSEQEAMREAIDNGEFVLVERWHNRMERREVMFVQGVDEPILDVPHPFRKMIFPQVTDMLGQPVFDIDPITGEPTEPTLDLENGEEASGWLVEQGFPFAAIKFDLSQESFYPLGHLRYIEDIQNAIIEQVSRISDMLKRTSRMTAIRSSELENNPEIGEILRTGRDGEFIGVEDLSSIRELNWGSVPGDVYNYFQMMMGMEQEISALAPQKPGDSETATEASIVAAASQINGNWMEAAVNEFYENIVRNAFQIMGDPRYTPENFVENIAPEGDQRVVRALTTSDFLYNYRIETKVGSTQPLYAQLERDRTMAFVGWASNRPNYDQMEIDKLAAEANGIQDVDKVLVDQDNVEAQRAAQYENDRVMVGQGIEVLPQQDHAAHMEVHNMYREHPQYIQLMQQAQAIDMVGNPANPQAGQQIQAIDQAIGQHVMQHQQAMEQEQQGETTLGGGAEAVQASQTQPDLISQVQSNAQRTADSIQNQTEGM